MAVDPSVVINLAAEYTGNKAFKQADTATQKLTNSVKSLAKTFGLAFGTTAVLAYGKAAVKAAAADQKAQKQLALALKNVGLERDAASAESYIQRLQSEFGVVDDLLRPSYQQLAVATRNTAETQRLMGLALDLSASTGKDLSAVTGALSKAYLGNNTALSKLGVGISKADLKTKSFKEITDELAKTFKGSAAASAATFAGSMAKLGVASENVKEIIGTGIIDALLMLSDDKTVDNLATSMQDLATYTGDVIRGIGVLTAAIKNIPGLGGLNGAAIVQAIPILGSYITLLNQAGAKARRIAEVGAQRNPIQAGTYLKTQIKITKLTKEEAAAQAKILADKKLGAAIDKANLALNKGQDIFNMDAIQLNAAMLNQAEQLGKVTNTAQLLAITNDITRLKIKQDIANLEDAIASKDTARIEAATKQLNEDLKILGTLQKQDIKLADIKSILDKIVPKDLINLANLDAAIAKLNAMSNITGQPKITGAGASKGGVSSAGIPIGDFVEKIPTSGVSMAAIEEFAAAATARANAMADLLDAQNAADAAAFANSSLNSFNITINTGVGDPNAIAETLDQYLQGAVDRGTLRLR
jgi:hypothetical protein